MGLGAMRDTVQQQPWQYLCKNLQSVMHSTLTLLTLGFCCDLTCVTRFLRCFPWIQPSNPSPLRHSLLIGVYSAPLITQLVAFLTES